MASLAVRAVSFAVICAVLSSCDEPVDGGAGSASSAFSPVTDAARVASPADGAAEAFSQFTARIDRNEVREFFEILAHSDRELADALHGVFEQAANATTNPLGLSELPESADVFSFYLWAPLIEHLRDLRLASGFDPRAGLFDPRVVRLRFLPEAAAASWRDPADRGDWVAGVRELDRLCRLSGMRLVALDNGSDSYVFAVVAAAKHDRFVELGAVVGQRVRRIDEVPF